MNNGEIIKYYRNKRGLSLEMLSEGIFTTDQLSDIENIKLEPSPNHLELIADKLELNKNVFSASSNSIIEDKLYSLYESTVNQNKKAAQDKLMYINDEYKLEIPSNHSDIFLLYLIVKLKFYLLNNDKKVIKLIYDQIKELPASLNNKIEYIRSKTLGIYYYRTHRLLESSAALDDAVHLSNQLLGITDEDRAELYYQVALTKLKTTDAIESINYARNALDLYQSVDFSKRSAECHIILGINFSRTKQLALAENHFLSAKSIGENIGDVYIQSMALQNIGGVKSADGNSEEAIFCFLESLKMKKDVDRSIYSIHTLVLEYYKLNQYDFSKEWAEQGLTLAKQSNMPEYILHFTVYLYLLDNDQKIETFIIEEVLPYFKNSGNEAFFIKYSELLAAYYFRNKDFKSACKYYELSLRALKEKSCI